MTAKQLFDYVMSYREKKGIPDFPGLRIQIYSDTKNPRFAVFLKENSEQLNVLFIMYEDMKSFRVDIYNEERGRGKNRPEWKRNGCSDDIQFDEDISVLPDRFPMWDLDKIVNLLNSHHIEGNDSK